MLGIFGGKKHVASSVAYWAERYRIPKYVVKRFARGNVTLQQGFYLDDAGLRGLRYWGDDAQKNIEQFLKENDSVSL